MTKDMGWTTMEIIEERERLEEMLETNWNKMAMLFRTGQTKEATFRFTLIKAVLKQEKNLAGGM